MDWRIHIKTNICSTYVFLPPMVEFKSNYYHSALQFVVNDTHLCVVLATEFLLSFLLKMI